MSQPSKYPNYLSDHRVISHSSESSSQRNSLKLSAKSSTRMPFPSTPSNHMSFNGGAAAIKRTSLPLLPGHLKTVATPTPKIGSVITDHPTYQYTPQHGRRSSTPDRATASTVSNHYSNTKPPSPRSQRKYTGTDGMTFNNYDPPRTITPFAGEQPSNSNYNNSKPSSPLSQCKSTHTTVSNTTDAKRHVSSDTAALLPTLDHPTLSSKKHDVNVTLSSTTGGLSLKDSSTFTMDSQQGLVGLRNLGNTCYMNSILQCLSATKCLTTVMINNEKDILKRAKKSGVVQGYMDLLKQMWRSEKTTSAIAPSLFKQRLQRLAPQFQGYDQHDSQEFLRFLLNGLHDELNKAHPPRRGSSLSPSPTITEDKAMRAWRVSLEYDNSEISDIFMGQLRSTLHCKQCGHDSVTFDPFWDLSLPIPRPKSKSITSYSSSYLSDGAVSLDDCFELFTAIEKLDGDNKPLCESCKGLQPGTKRLSVQRFPTILVIHLKRFSGLHYRTKLSTSVRFEETMTLSPEEDEPVQYALYAISNHSGSCYGGHYTAYCRHPVQKRWYLFNDSSVAPVSSASIQTNQAYVLFYKKLHD